MGLKRFSKNTASAIDKLFYKLKAVIFGKQDCTKYTERCKYHSACCTRNLKTILEYIDKLFRENRIKYWLDYGTLLGAVREKDLIEYDTDLDIGILNEDKERLLLLKERINRDGFFFSRDHKMDFYRINLSLINTLHMDIFIWLESENGQLFRSEYMSKDKNKGKDFSKELIEDLETAEIDGKYYPVPAHPEEFCRFRFGDDWNRRIKE